MAQTVQMTTEQLQQLIEAVRVSATNAAVAGINQNADAFKPKASFSNCREQFWGERDHNVVENFITNIVTYKEIESISDEDALKGVSLLFYNNASTWWQGIRKEAKCWDDVIRLLREHFSPVKPPHQVYMEIFDKKQNDHEAIDTFVCEKRALLAQLPDGRHDEETELDLIYGLINLKYRKHIPRQDFQTFKELLEKGRIIEHNKLESEKLEKEKGSSKRCSYCNFRGHKRDQCRKRRKDEETKQHVNEEEEK